MAIDRSNYTEPFDTFGCPCFPRGCVVAILMFFTIPLHIVACVLPFATTELSLNSDQGISLSHSERTANPSAILLDVGIKGENFQSERAEIGIFASCAIDGELQVCGLTTSDCREYYGSINAARAFYILSLFIGVTGGFMGGIFNCFGCIRSLWVSMCLGIAIIFEAIGVFVAFAMFPKSFCDKPSFHELGLAIHASAPCLFAVMILTLFALCASGCMGKGEHDDPGLTEEEREENEAGKRREQQQWNKQQQQQQNRQHPQHHQHQPRPSSTSPRPGHGHGGNPLR